ncbi:MAG: hypothetical protein U5R14_03105 [Gemmatimonadota bacterium]|nr:hypothetical protein [Gemmatimonadota bacterium]
MKKLVALTALLSTGVLAACLDDDITGTRALSFTLTADPASAEVGDSITFTYDASGTSILGVLLDYGDGVQDTIVAQTPNQVERIEEVKYAYEIAGSFEVVGRLETGDGGTSDTVSVEISEPGGS